MGAIEISLKAMQSPFVAVGLAAKEVAKSWGSKSTVVNAAAFLLGAFRPAGTTLLVGLSTMLQQRLPRHRQ